MPGRHSLVRDSYRVENHLNTKFIAGCEIIDPMERLKCVLGSVPKTKHVHSSILRNSGVTPVNRELCRFFSPALGLF